MGMASGKSGLLLVAVLICAMHISACYEATSIETSNQEMINTNSFTNNVPNENDGTSNIYSKEDLPNHTTMTIISEYEGEITHNAGKLLETINITENLNSSETIALMNISNIGIVSHDTVTSMNSLEQASIGVESATSLLITVDKGSNSTSEEATFDPDEEITSVPVGTGVVIVAAPDLKHVYTGIGLLGMLANTVVICSLLNQRKLLKVVTNQLILNQSCIDFLASSLVWTVHVFYNHLQIPHGLPRHIFCKLWLSRFLMWGMFQASTHNLVALTLERYIAIVHPIYHRIVAKPWLKRFVFLVIWLIGPVSDGVFNISAAHINPEGRCVLYSLWGGALLQKIRGCLTFVGNFLLPFLIILFCHLSILVVLRKSQQEQTERATVNRDVALSKAVRNVVRTLIIVSACFIICWAFNQILFFSFNLGLQVDFTGAFYHFSVILAFSNCSINPFIYSLNYRPVKRAACKLLFGSCKKSMTLNSSNEMTSTSRQDDFSFATAPAFS